MVVLGGNPADNSYDMKISVFSPAYMSASRPSITAAPATLAYGSSATISATGTIQYVSLLAPMSVTHQTDPNARLVDVPFVKNPDGSLKITMPANSNIAPPGPYMLVVQNSAGTPSIAKWVTVG